jgi:hypothetical protein
METCTAPTCTFTAGDEASCTGTAGCAYTADDAGTAGVDEEACTTPTCSFTAGDEASCTGTTGCAYTAPVTAAPWEAEACFPGAAYCAENEHVASGACAPCTYATTRPAGDDPTGADTECLGTCASVSSADCGPGYLAARGGCVCANSEGLTDEQPGSSMCAAHADMWGITGDQYCTPNQDDDPLSNFCGGTWDGCVYEGAVAPQDLNILPSVPLAAACAGAVCDVANVPADRAACCIAEPGIDCSAVSPDAPCNVMYLIDQVRDARSLQDIDPLTFCPCKWVRDASPHYDPSVVAACEGGP